MRILLTGACGRLGRAVRELGAEDHEFVLLDMDEAVREAGGCVGNVTDRDLVFRLAEGCDAIIHTAAMHGAFRDKATNAQFIETNITGSDHLFQAAVHHGVRRVVVSSTMEVLIGFNCNAYGTAVLDETMTPRPDWIYPLTKYQVEVMSHYYAQVHGLEVVNLRYGDFCHKNNVPKIGLGLLACGLVPLDAGRANLLAVTRPGIKDEVLLIGPDTPLTQQDVNKWSRDPWSVLERYWPGSSDVVKAAGHKPREELMGVMKIDRAKAMLGYEPESRFEVFLRHHGWAGSRSPSVAAQKV